MLLADANKNSVLRLAKANHQKRINLFESQIRLKIQIKEGVCMMPLTLAGLGEENIVKKVGGSPETKKHLENLGFVAGSSVTIVNTLAGNIIVKVKEARVALSRELAQKIMI